MEDSIFLFDRIAQFLGRVVSWMLLVMTFLGAGNALLRYLGKFAGRNLTSNALLEGQWYIFSLIFLLGAAAALRKDSHVRVDIFYQRLSKKTRARVDLLGLALLFVPMMIFSIWSSWDFVFESWRIREISPDAGGLPRYPVKTLLIMAFITLFFQGISEIVHRISILKEDSIEGESIEAEES